MFFGKGDTSKLVDPEQETLAHLRRMTETGHLVALDPEQTAVALRAFNFYERWEQTFSAVSSLRNVLLLIGGGLGFWWVTGGENFVSAFIQRVVAS